MIIKSFQLDKINFKTFDIFLLYGKNEGFKNEVINKYFVNKLDGELTKYDEQEFIENSEIIVSELLNKSLFDNQKILIISRVSDKIIKIIQDLLQRDLLDTKIILKASSLEKKSKIRNFFEKDKNLACIPFYEDDDKSLNLILNQFLIKYNLKMSREITNLLIDRSNGNRESLEKELDKIYYYSISNKKIDLNAVRKLTNLSENYDVSELIDNCLAKNNKKVSKILNENNYSNEDCILILRTLLNRSKRLLNIIENYKKTKNIENVIINLRPPIFWKEREIVKKQANMWEIDDLKNRIYKINELELMIKNNSKNSYNLVSDFVINY
tara:strand:+ start:584 stop:1561 length:978 start_codon:yes stop_codon:yes gene_type:complete